MTRKVEASSNPPITRQEQINVAHDQQDADLSLTNENVVDLSDIDEEPGYSMINHAYVPMHHFGAFSGGNPANYRTTAPLREDLHFTDATLTQDIEGVSAELNSLLREEFTQCDVLDYLEASFVETPECMHTPFETGNQGYGKFVSDP